MNSSILTTIENALGGFDLGYLMIGMAALLMILLILVIVQICAVNKLKKRLNKFDGERRHESRTGNRRIV